jgi:hypothetical protein
MVRMRAEKSSGKNDQTLQGCLQPMADGKQADTVFTLDRASFNQGKNAQYNFKIGQDEIADTLVARGPGAVAILGDKDDLQDNRESPK